MAATITNIDTYGSHGWQWDVEFTEEDQPPFRRHYHTSHDGDGLWMGDKQIEGTSQFVLPRTRKAVASNLARRWH